MSERIGLAGEWALINGCHHLWRLLDVLVIPTTPMDQGRFMDSKEDPMAQYSTSHTSAPERPS
jgi:hypothetical protein